MVIRTEQTAIFDHVARTTYPKQLAAYIRARHGGTIVRLSSGESPVSAIPDATLEALVQKWHTAGRLPWHFLAIGSGVILFVMFVVAPNFDQDASVRELLSDEDIEPDYRMDSVWERVTEEKWNVLRHKCDVNAWGL